MLQKRGLVWLSRPASASWVCACAESGVLRGGGGVSEAPGTYCPLGFWGCRLVGERKGHIPPPFFFACRDCTRMTWACLVWPLIWLLILLICPRKPSLDMTTRCIDHMSFFDALFNE